MILEAIVGSAHRRLLKKTSKAFGKTFCSLCSTATTLPSGGWYGRLTGPMTPLYLLPRHPTPTIRTSFIMSLRLAGFGERQRSERGES